MAMGRMGITNLTMLLQAALLSMFPSNTSSMNSANKITLYIDILYRIVLCTWFFLHTDYHQVKATLALVYNYTHRRTDDMNHASGLTNRNIAHSDEQPQNITVQTTTTVNESYHHQDIEKQGPLAPSKADNTFKHLVVVKIKPQTVSLSYSVEEKLSSYSVPFVLFPDNFFPSDNNPHWQYQTESHSAHEWTQLEPLQHNHNRTSHEQDHEYSRVFLTPQIESSTPSSVRFEPGITLPDIASLSTDKSQLQTGMHTV